MSIARQTIVALSGLLAAAAISRAEGVDVSPLVNDRTVFMARADLSKVDLPAAANRAKQTLNDAKIPAILTDSLFRDLTRGLAQVQTVINAMVKAGVTQTAFVMNVGEAGFRGEPHVMMMIATADPDAISAALKPLPVTTVDLDGVTVWTAATDGDYVRQITPSPRPDLIRGIDHLDAATVVVAGGIAEAGRAELLKGLPQGRDPFGLPPALSPFGNVIVARARVDTAAGPHVTIAADVKDPAALTAWLDQMKASPQTANLAKALPVTTAGQTLTLEVRQPELQNIASALPPVLQRTHRQALRVKSMSNMRQLLLACRMYSNQNKDAPPPSLDKLGVFLGRRDGVIPPQVLTNPQRPELGVAGYVYVPASEADVNQIKRPGERLALYEAGDFGDGISVGFMDGHVEFITDVNQFKALLAAAQRAVAQPAAQPAVPVPATLPAAR